MQLELTDQAEAVHLVDETGIFAGAIAWLVLYQYPPLAAGTVAHIALGGFIVACYTGVIAGGGTRRGYVHGKSDKTGSAPLENPVHPRDLLATIYHSVGINPATIVYNHINQPRELVQGEAVTSLLS
jgi:hypothetical protein